MSCLKECLRVSAFPCTFCCRPLKSVVNAAVVYTVFNFICFSVADVFLIACIYLREVFGTALPPAFNLYLDACNSLPHRDVILWLLIVRLFIKFIWLLTAPLLWVGNREDKSVYMLSWLTLAMISLVYSTALAIFYIAKLFKNGFLSNFLVWTANMRSSSPSKQSADSAVDFTLFVSFLDGVIFFYVPTLIFIICVHIRCRKSAQRAHLRVGARKNDILCPINFNMNEAYELAPYRIPRPRISDSSRARPHSDSFTMRHSCNTGDCNGTCGPIPSRSISRIYSMHSPQCAYDNRAFTAIDEVVEPTTLNTTPLNMYDVSVPDFSNTSTEALYARPNKVSTSPSVYI